MSEVSSSAELRSAKCVPCEGGIPKLTSDEAAVQLQELNGWQLLSGPDRIRREWRVRNFMAGIEFFNAVAELAESEGHHPDLHIQGYRNVSIDIWTHAVGGLSRNDFVLAAKLDQLPIAAVAE
jgi:4a-hydroxytetrahydrobiopterin dehydratase